MFNQSLIIHYVLILFGAIQIGCATNYGDPTVKINNASKVLSTGQNGCSNGAIRTIVNGM